MQKTLSSLIDGAVKKKNIFKASLFFAVLLNLDKLVFGLLTPIRVHDTFDSCLPLAVSTANNYLRYGFCVQLPQILCGISSYSHPVPLGYLMTQLIFPPYVNYLVHSVGAVFIAFIGMYLLLIDGFKISDKASFIGALFFCSIDIFIPFSLTVVGIPLFLWAFEKMIDGGYSYAKRVALFLYIIVYFLCSSFYIISFVLIPLFFTYLLFFSGVKKIVKNIVVICAVWSVYLLLNVPSLTEILFNAPDSHRYNLAAYGSFSLMDAWRYMVEKVFSFDMHGLSIAMPTFLGVLVVLFYIVSSKKKDRSKYFYFPIVLILSIEFFSFFIYKSPLMSVLKKYLSVLKMVQLDRFYFLLNMFFAVLIGQACDLIIRGDEIMNTRRWATSASFVLLYIGVSLKLHSFENCPFLFSQIIVQIVCLFFFLGLLILRLTGKRRVSSFHILLFPFVLFLLLNTADVRAYWMQREHSSIYNFFNSPQIEEIKRTEGENIGNFRVVKIGGWHPAQLLGNGFKCADGYVNVYARSYMEFWEKVIEPELTKSERWRRYFLGFGGRVYLFDSLNKGDAVHELSFNPELLRLINVKYLFSDKEVVDHEKYGFIEVAAKSPAYRGLSGRKRFFRKREFYVYQNKVFSPPVFLTEFVKMFSTKKKLLESLGTRKYGYLKERTYVLKEDIVPATLKRFDGEGAKIINYGLSPDRVEVRLRNTNPVVLNWTRNYNKNWHCRIDGKEAKIFRIYNSFMGVIVPARSQEVVFTYKNKYLSYAYLVSLAGIALIITFLAVYFKREANNRV